MAARKTAFAPGEFYHVYNRGVDKRTVFSDRHDLQRFMQSMVEFNELEPIGSLYERSFVDGAEKPKIGRERLVNIVAYCLNPNHYHLLLEQVADGGVSEFMKRLSGGYTVYFNNKHKRSGALFQGRFRSVHVNSNEYLLHVSAYVNLNDRVHKLGGSTPKLVQSVSSWEEYKGKKVDCICSKQIVLEQFNSKREYVNFAESSLSTIKDRKKDMKDLQQLFLEDPLGG